MSNSAAMSPDTLATILREQLQATDVTVEDESHLHAGHAGAGGGGHYRVRIVSPLFEGLPLVKQHRLVYGALKDHMASSIHALALTTLTPDRSAS